MSEFCIEGDRNILAGRDVTIFQIIDSINSLEDLDTAIEATQEYMTRLNRKKGFVDARILLMLGIVITVLLAYAKQDWTSLFYLAMTGVLLYLGIRCQQYVAKLNTELTAAHALLVDLYKQRLARRFTT